MKKISGLGYNEKIRAKWLLAVFFTVLGLIVAITSGK